MLVKIVSLFLIGIAVLAMFGRLRLPGASRRIGKGETPTKPKKCRQCGAYMIGEGPCPCRRKG
jgi:hypothetical protein